MDTAVTEKFLTFFKKDPRGFLFASRPLAR